MVLEPKRADVIASFRRTFRPGIAVLRDGG